MASQTITPLTSLRASYSISYTKATTVQVRWMTGASIKRHSSAPLRGSGLQQYRPAASTLADSVTFRHLSTTSRSSKPLTATISSSPANPQPSTPTIPPLSTLPLSTLLRTYLITTISARPLLLTTTISLLQSMLSSRSPLFNVNHNPFLRWALKKTFYAQFCAGEDAAEVARFVQKMDKVGYSGVALEYASEVLEDGKGSEAEEVRGLERWERGILESVEMAREGSFVAFKYSGIGPSTLRRLKANAPPTPLESASIHRICAAASRKYIRISPAAEPQSAQRAVNDWTLSLARTYNRGPNAPALIYNTYQCYLLSTPRTLYHDLKTAEREGFTLGVKLVRGAYLATEERGLIYGTKRQTDEAYDGIAEALLRGRFEGALGFENGAEGEGMGVLMKRVDVLLATHNAETVEMALRVRAARMAEMEMEMDVQTRTQTHTQPQQTSQAQAQAQSDLSFAQLQGMADEVSCALLAAQRTNASSPFPFTNSPSLSPSLSPSPTHKTYCKGPSPHVYKYCNWGTLSECLAYLTRRAAENRDAAGRTRNTAVAMKGEIVRRLRGGVGL